MSGNDEPVTTSSQRYVPRAASPATFELQVVSGPDEGSLLSLSGQTGGPVLVGTSSVCGLRLEDREVSRRHLQLEIEGQRLRVTDLESTNGTRLDGVRIADAWAEVGQTLTVGASSIQVISSGIASGGDAPVERSSFGSFLGSSPELQRLYPLAARLAASDVTVVIEGETGTGKEVMAEALHEHSQRAGAPYVVLDCTTLPAHLIEAELFGHERGAFTGAVAARSGVFEQADGGTLFIDEIGDLELSLQPKLLRVLERGELRRVGGSRVIRVDVRVIAATRRNLDQAVEQGLFRDDLFHRLAVGRLSLPALRRRRGDVALLAEHFWRELAPEGQHLPARLLESWEREPWPGNVRELRNVIARRIATGDFSTQPVPTGNGPSDPTDSKEAPSRDSISAEVQQVLDGAAAGLRELLWSEAPIPVARVKLLEAYQKARVERALLEHGGAVDAAARSLGIGRRYLHMLKAGPRKRTRSEVSGRE